MSDNTFFSQATNFSSAVAGGVDLRTGLYNLHINLGHIVGNHGQGPTFPLVLSYSPMSQDDIGFGIGITLGLSTYDTDSQRLSLSTGEQYQIDEDNSGVYVKQKKLDNFIFEKQEGDAYKITHKTGDIEILAGEDYGPYLKLPTQIITAAGHSLSLTTDDNNHLTEIRDDTESLLTINGYDDGQITLTFYPGKSESYQATLEKNNAYLTTVTNNALSDTPLVWSINYDDMNYWGHWATSLTSPGGMKEEAKYRNDRYTNQFPASAPQELQNNPLPFVEKFVQTPKGNQPPIISSYIYSNTNFLGFDSGVDWNAQQDNLYNCSNDYTYHSTETRQCNATTTTIKCIYNSYHLQINNITQTNNNKMTKEIEYYAVNGDGFDNQPAQFQLPKQTKITWEDGSQERTETTITEFDTSGNPTKNIAADGTITTWEYYSANGEKGCPTEPNGFTRFIKTMTVTARSTSYNVPVHQTQYEYDTFEHKGDVTHALILKSKETHLVDSQTLTQTTFTYGQGDYAGYLVQKDTTHDGQQLQYTTQETISYAEDSNTEAYVKTHALTTHDHLSLTRSQTLSKVTGRIWQSVDAKGNITRYQYDVLGRKTYQTLNPDTQYENTIQYAYQFTQEDAIPFYVITTDTLGNKQRHALDAAGRHLQTEANDIDSGNGNTWYRLRQQQYDEQGRKSSAKVSDYADPQSEETSVSLEQTLAYDDWGQAHKTTYSDGIAMESQIDPVKLRKISTQTGGNTQTGLTATSYDDSHNPVSISLYTAGKTPGVDLPYSTVTHEFDGWNQLRCQTDVLGQVTRYEYDVWGRVITTTLPDNSQIKRQYADFSSEKLLTAISVSKDSKETLLGIQTFDGLGRLVERNTGGRTWIYHYQTASNHHPTTITTPDGMTHSYTYIDALGELPSTRTVGDITQSWQYNPITAVIEKATEGNSHIDYDYYPSGHPKSRTVDHDGNGLTSAVTYTVMGRIKTIQDFSGNTQTIERDSHGRVIKQDNDAVASSLTYDDVGRLTSWTVSSKTTNYSQTTTLTLDDFGRETQRTITDRDNNSLSINQLWNKNHQVSRKTTARNNATIRDENYTYNNRNQLTNYTVSGSEPPTDESGLFLQEQTYTYDVLGNILTKDTSYTTGINNQTQFFYTNPDDPCQLTRLTNSHPSSPPAIDFTYDKAGRMLQDETGIALHYDALGRLSSSHNNNGNHGSSYEYDAHNRLSVQTTDNISSYHYYQGTSLSYLLDTQGNSTRLFSVAGEQIAQARVGHHAGVWLSTQDAMGSVLSVNDGTDQQEYAYTPYGEQGKTGNQDNVSPLGLNGEKYDSTTGHYPLGNGYRSFSPTLMRFLAPDSMSPFGQGGINPYAYCAGDPINYADPTGHFHIGWQGWLGLGLAAVGLLLIPLTGGGSLAVAGAVLGGLSTVTGIAADNTKGIAHTILAYIALGTAIAGGIADVTDIGTLAYRGYRGITELAEHGPFLLSGSAGDAAKAGKAMRNVTDESAMDYISNTTNFKHEINSDGYSISSSDNVFLGNKFINKYEPKKWTFMFNDREDKRAPYYANHVTQYQYKTISEAHGFYKDLPDTIVRQSVANKITLDKTKGLEGNELFKAFFETPNGKSTQHIMDSFNLKATKVTHKIGDFTISVVPRTTDV